MSQEKDQTNTQDFVPDQVSPASSKDGDSNASEKGVSDPELGPRGTHTNTGAAAGLTQEHRDYLIQRHGTLDLDPLPGCDGADPMNWPQWKKLCNLGLVAFHALMTTFFAAGIIPAYEAMAEEFNTSIHHCSYLTSLQIAILGYAPLIWKPLANRYGRRPIFLISVLGSLVCNIGCAVAPGYGSMAACRALVALFIAPPIAIGSGIVTETFFRKDRGKYIGVWTLLVTLGPPSAPFFMGFVAYQTGDYRWIYWIFVIINAVQFVLYLFLGPETRYIRQGVPHEGSPFKQEYIHGLQFKRIDPTPMTFKEFIAPFKLFTYPAVVIPSCAYAIVFTYVGVLLTVEIPQLFVPKFGFNEQQIGLQFLGIIIGSIIGEQLGGRLSDWWMNHRTKKLGTRPEAEYRLWLAYPGFLLAIVGLIVFGVRFQQAPQGDWNVTPIIGIAIAAVGNQVITSVLVTYAVDSHLEHSASIGVFVNIVRQTWAFIGPFYFPDMLDALNVAGTCGLLAALIAVPAAASVFLLQFIRERKQKQKLRGSVESAAEGQGVVPMRQ